MENHCTDLTDARDNIRTYNLLIAHGLIIADNLQVACIHASVKMLMIRTANK